MPLALNLPPVSKVSGDFNARSDFVFGEEGATKPLRTQARSDTNNQSRFFIVPERSTPRSAETTSIDCNESTIALGGLRGAIGRVSERVHVRRAVIGQKKANTKGIAEQYRLRRTWDDDIGTEGYNDRIRSSNMGILRKRRALSASKKYRANERYATRKVDKIDRAIQNRLERGERRTESHEAEARSTELVSRYVDNYEPGELTERVVENINTASPLSIAFRGLLGFINERRDWRAGKRAEELENLPEPDEETKAVIAGYRQNKVRFQRQAQKHRLRQSGLRKQTEPVDVSGWM
jgi:hypothetical protein